MKIISWFDILKEIVRIPFMCIIKFSLHIIDKFDGGFVMALGLSSTLATLLFTPAILFFSFKCIVLGNICFLLPLYSFILFIRNDNEETFLKSFWRLIFRSLWKKMVKRKVIRYEFERQLFIEIGTKGIKITGKQYTKRNMKVIV